MSQLSLDFKLRESATPLSSVQGIPVYESRKYKGIYDLAGYGLKVVRERAYLEDRITVSHPYDVYPLLEELYKGMEKEMFFTLLLDSRNQVEGIDLVSIGSLNYSLIHPREVFRLPVILSSASILISHNHPSGDAAPSAEDISLTKRLADCGTLFGIELLDHLIYAAPDKVLSMKEAGMF